MIQQNNSHKSDGRLLVSSARKRNAIIFLVIMLIIAVIAIAMYTLNLYNDLDDNLIHAAYPYNLNEASKIEYMTDIGNFFSYGTADVPSLGVSIINTFLELIWIGLPIYAVIKFFQMRNSHIEVSETMINGYESFGKSVSIPIDTVSSINKGIYNSVKITSGGKKTVFWLLDNSDEITNFITERISENITKKNPRWEKVKQMN